METGFDHIDELIAKVLAGEASHEESVALTTWKQMSSENEHYYQESEKIFNAVNSLTNKYEVNTDAAWQNLNKRLDQGGAKVIPFYRSPVVLRAAAGLAILIVLTVVSKWLLNDEPIEPLVFKSKAKTEQTTLPDGSKVFMNKHSEIAYSINDKGERKVSLKGEAFFEVKHDEKKPFVIQVNEVMIKDIGTAFNVKAVPENNTVEVVVESGEVQFYTSANAGLSLVKGEKAIYEKNTGRFTKVLPTPTENTVSYKSKQFEFKATLLKEVVDQLNAVYPIKIVLQDKSLESMRLSVSFNNEAPEDIIEIIADTFDLETEKTDSTVILKPKKQLN